MLRKVSRMTGKLKENFPHYTEEYEGQTGGRAMQKLEWREYCMLWMFYVATSGGIIPLATARHIWALNYIIQRKTETGLTGDRGDLLSLRLIRL